MPDMSPTGRRSMGGDGLISRTRDWDTGTPHGFKGSIHPFPGKADKVKDAANVKQPSGKSMPPSAGSGGPRKFPPPKNVQSAKAPDHPMPAAIGRMTGIKQSGVKAIQAGKSKSDHGPRGSGRTGGRGVTK